MRIRHIIAGTVLLGLGLAGIYDEYFVVVEFLKGASQPLTALVGVIAVISGVSKRKRPNRRLGSSTVHIVFGLVLLALAVYGFYDNYYAVMDFIKGSTPIILIGVGTIAVFSGINRLRMANS